MPLQARHIFLTGQPGVGKTTLACAAVKEQPASCGFYTAEKRAAAGEREGFSVVALGSGETGTLASLGRGKAMVGKYCVDVASFERVALPSLEASASSPITLIDEVGKMELFSPLFLPRVEAILTSGEATVLGTLPMPRYGHTIASVEALRAHPDVAVVGTVVFGECVEYTSRKQWDADAKRHCVPSDDAAYAFVEGDSPKFGWVVQRCEAADKPRPIPTLRRRVRSLFLLDNDDPGPE